MKYTPTTMVDNNCIIEGNVKFRDGKKWKSRWCVMRKLSPVADCLHLQLYGDSKDKYKQGQTKASLSLQDFLGIESGFTLDKESNTIAIICQDLIVVLAFDTRERLIQWQVKISTNLGEDQQFLVLMSSAPLKAKIPNGPAHFHVQDRRFCITVGVPPRLIGVWEIGHLRRYGVVEGRFCFEGGSRCGRGEGLHVLITDQGDDIVKTVQLAAEGKLATRKRPLARELSAQESPRRQCSRSDTRASDFFNSSVYHGTVYQDQVDAGKTGDNNTVCWSSAESRHNVDLETTEHHCNREADIANSSNELIDEDNGEWSSGTIPIKKPNNSGLERCASCVSKLGGASKTSVSSAAAVNAQARAFDRLSLSSYSTSSHDSDYSGFLPSNTEVTKSSQSSEFTEAKKSSVSPKPSQKAHKAHKAPKKPPMPLPEQVCTCSNIQNKNRRVGPLENYDVPKTILAHHMSLEPPQQTQDQYYDTPRKIKECLALPKSYPNYDTPYAPQAVALQQCGCPAKLPVQSPRTICPCHNMMSWAGFVLPYCRRGAGIEPTGVTVHPIKLSGEGRMPVVNANREMAFYNPVVNAQLSSDQTASQSSSSNSSNNYENVTPILDSATQLDDSKTSNTSQNYVNIDFSQSLEHYENGKDVITKSGISDEEIQQIAHELTDDNGIDKSQESSLSDTEKEIETICHKCGHLKESATDYLLMDPDKQSAMKKPFSGYLTMQPVHNACSKGVLSRICSNATKSSSNPALFGSSSIDLAASRKRSDSELRIPGSAMLSSPYLRRRLIDQIQPTEASASLEILWRKRSYSAESAHYLEDSSPSFSSALGVHKCSSETSKVSNSEEQGAKLVDELINTPTLQPFAIKIRRSSSVPSKTGHNRDSSSSNDSGVSTGSLSHRNADLVEFELSPVIINKTSKKQQNTSAISGKRSPPSQQPQACYHSSLPRKSKSSDPLRELSFQFQKIKVPTKSSSAEGEIPTCLPKAPKGFTSPGETSGTPYIDSRSTSSGTSDMSDYIETLSMSSHSSSDTPDGLRFSGRAVATVLRPRSGKEYYKIDRTILNNEQGRSTTQTTYANITPVIEKSESPSPGYMSSSPFDQPQTSSRQRFLFPEVSDIN